MIIGECPYDECQHSEMRIVPDKPLPIFSKEECRGCGRTVWVYYSRVDPAVYTEEGFNEEWDLGEDKVIRPRKKPQH